MFPTISWQTYGKVDSTGQQSLIISLLRGLAAVQVAVAHLRAEMFPSLRGMTDPPLAYQGLAFLTGFAHQAVVVFFLISGWLVGGSLLNRWGQPHAMSSYAIDRATRLWTVLIPTFALMLLAALFMEKIVLAPSGMETGNEYSAWTLFGNLFGLQTIFVDKFGRNYALWSLSNETWYYVLFPLLLLVFRARTVWRQAGSAVVIAVIASLLPVSILLYFTLWLLGAAFARIRLTCSLTSRCMLLALTAACSLYYRLTGSNDDLVQESFLQDLICSVPFLFFLASMTQPLPSPSPALRRLQGGAHALSELSFTLYVIHVPTIALLRYLGLTYLGRDTLSPYAVADYLVYATTAALLLGIAGISYLMFESNTGKVRRFVKNKLLATDTPAPQVAVMRAKQL